MLQLVWGYADALHPFCETAPQVWEDAENSLPSLASATGCRRGRRMEKRIRSRSRLRDAPYVPPPYGITMQESRGLGALTELPSHISKMVVSTVRAGGPKWTVGSTVFKMWLGTL